LDEDERLLRRIAQGRPAAAAAEAPPALILAATYAQRRARERAMAARLQASSFL